MKIIPDMMQPASELTGHGLGGTSMAVGPQLR
jgi:hypothetical protein